jgi:formylglycine-generating enzyme
MPPRFASLAAALALVAACSSHGGAPHETSSSSGAGGSGGEGGSGKATDAGNADAADGATFDCAVLGVPGSCIDTAACAAMTDELSTPGYCPGPASIECCTPYGAALCDPTAKPRPEPNAGNTVEAPGEGGCPDGMIAVTTFCVDKYEATLVVLATGDAWCPFDNPGTTPMRAISVAGAVPQAYISQIQAGEACANAGKRLCQDAEWLRACQGPGDTTYPYGNTDELGVCNDHRAEHPAIEYFGTSASWIYTMLDNSCLDQIPETVDPTGSRTGCVTAEGAYDMMGNVHEWTGTTTGANGAFRGGYYVDTVLNGPGCLYVTTAHETSYWDYSTGFRCCAD